MKNKKGGYTLVEVIVSILIIGLIVGAGLLLYVRSTNVKLKSTKNNNIANRIEDIFNEFETDDNFYINYLESSNTKTIYYDTVFQEVVESGDNYIVVKYITSGDYMEIDIQVYDNGVLYSYLNQDIFSMRRHSHA